MIKCDKTYVYVHGIQTDSAEKPLFMRFMATLKDILHQ